MTLIPPDAGIRMRMQTEAGLIQPAAPVQEVLADFPELRTGQTFSAKIQDVLPDNTYRALVAGKQLTLQLPEGAKSGDTLELVVIDRTPRAVIAQLAEAAPAATGADELFKFTTLSKAGQMIGQLLLAEGESPQPAPLNRGQPLLAQAPTAGAAELAPALQKAVTQSGLFYEAHQAQWAVGRLPTEALLQEPQGQHSAPELLAQHGLPSAAGPSGHAAPPATAAAPATLMQTLFGGGERTNAVDTAAATSAAPTASQGVPEELRPLVQQQLDAATSQRLVWHGEVWPNQAMDWEIVREEEQRGKDQGTDDEASWRTTLRLDTPRLGHVDAALRLTSAGVHLMLSTPVDDSATDLRNAAPALAGTLAAAGIPLLSFQVKHEER